MNEETFIRLAKGCGWHVGPDYVTRGNWTISILSDGGLILKKWFIHLRKMQPYDAPDLRDLQNVPHRPWIIGPFKRGWFSLKANRWVK